MQVMRLCLRKITGILVVLLHYVTKVSLIHQKTTLTLFGYSPTLRNSKMNLRPSCIGGTSSMVSLVHKLKSCIALTEKI